MDIVELLRRLVAFGRVGYPKVSDFERALGPVFVDLDSSRESTMSVMRPHGAASAPFFYVEVLSGAHAGRATRVCARFPVTFGRARPARLALEQLALPAIAGEVSLVDGAPTLIPREDQPTLWVGGHAVKAPVTLRPGDEIVVGTDVLRVGEHPGWTDEDGFSPLVRWLSLSLAFDVYHERPNEDRDRDITSFMMIVVAPPADVEALFAAELGPARTLPNGWRALHPFYVADAAEGTSIRWSKEVPDEAIAAVDPSARTDFMRKLFLGLPSLSTLADVTAYADAHRDAAGITEANALNDDDIWIRFRPPLDARDVCRIAGWTNATAQTHDVHMSSWSIHEGRSLPKVGPWIVDVRLVRWPRRVDGAKRSAEDTYDMMEHTGDVEWIVVRHVREHDR